VHADGEFRDALLYSSAFSAFNFLVHGESRMGDWNTAACQARPVSDLGFGITEGLWNSLNSSNGICETLISCHESRKVSDVRPRLARAATQLHFLPSVCATQTTN
jgi:hypothetical protein